MTDNNKLIEWARECGAAVREGDICGEHVCVIVFSPEYLQAYTELVMKERDRYAEGFYAGKIYAQLELKDENAERKKLAIAVKALKSISSGDLGTALIIKGALDKIEGEWGVRMKMKFKKDQRITYKNGEKGTILTTERNHPKYPVVSIADEGDIWTHIPSGKVNPVDDNPYDIMPPVPQGKDLVGYLCGVSHVSLEAAQKHAKDCKHRIRLITDYDDNFNAPYRIDDHTGCKYAWPVSKSDLEGRLKEGE